MLLLILWNSSNGWWRPTKRFSFQAFNISVTDPAKFAGAYAQLMPALAAEGICPALGD